MRKIFFSVGAANFQFLFCFRISKELRPIVYCMALKYGGEKEWAFMWNLYHKSNVATEKSTILNSLACTREIWLLRRFLQWTVVHDSGVRKQDSTSVFASVAYNDVGYYVAKEFLHSQVAVVFKRYFETNFFN